MKDREREPALSAARLTQRTHERHETRARATHHTPARGGRETRGGRGGIRPLEEGRKGEVSREDTDKGRTRGANGECGSAAYRTREREAKGAGKRGMREDRGGRTDQRRQTGGSM